MSIAKLTAGPGYRYLLRHISRGDAPELSGDAMTRYYTTAGYPPGIWLGRGLSGLANGEGVTAGSTVSEEHMARLFGAGHDPVTDNALGRPYVTTPPLAERIATAVAQLPGDLVPEVRDARVAAITAAEKARPARGSVAGFDLTFSVPKSVSVLWALADRDVQRAIVDAHHAAIAVTLGLIERDVARTRTGHAGAAHVPVQGLVAAGFDHHDSRAGDPQLHTHVTVANRVQTADGRWRTLDGHALYAAGVAHSDTYDALLADNLTRALGVAWETRLRGRKRNPRRELAAVPDRLIAEFSKRSVAITAAKDEAIVEFVARHHREPTGPEAVRIRQRATLTTRQAKTATSLADYTRQWADRAANILRGDPHVWARHVTDHSRRTPVPAPHRSGAVDAATVEMLAAKALDEVEAKRATWSRWNIIAAACRAITHSDMHFTDAGELLAVRERVARAAMDRCVLLNPSDATMSENTRDPSTGRSIYDLPEVFTSPEVLAAEDRLLAATDDTTAPTITDDAVEHAITAPLANGRVLGPDQADAIRTIATSGRTVDVLVGPAGTGKTTTLTSLRAAWEAQHGPGSVVGLATSSTAAHVLAGEVAIAAENTAQWLAQQHAQSGRADRIHQMQARRDQMAAAGHNTERLDRALAHTIAEHARWALHLGVLLVLDEAGMADLHTIDALAAQTRAAGAKLLLVGDHHQLPAVGAGGAFRLLAHHHAHTAQLTGVHRFRNPDGTTRQWEAQASLHLRAGNPAALVTYRQHGRFADGSTEQMIDAAYTAWKTDRAIGLDSLLVAADNDTVQALNLKARADRIAAGQVRPAGPVLHDGTTAGAGDRIITRRVDRHLADGTGAGAVPDRYGRYASGFVTNGARFTVTATLPDGSLQARRDNRSTTVTLPADYVAQHVELGYAVTAHRCQGVTVDTTHTIADNRTTREAFYVAMTRGARSNRAYITTDRPSGDGDHVAFGPDTSSGDAVLRSILTRQAAEQSAHQQSRTRSAQPRGPAIASRLMSSAADRRPTSQRPPLAAEPGRR